MPTKRNKIVVMKINNKFATPHLTRHLKNNCLQTKVWTIFKKFIILRDRMNVLFFFYLKQKKQNFFSSKLVRT